MKTQFILCTVFELCIVILHIFVATLLPILLELKFMRYHGHVYKALPVWTAICS